MQRATTPPTSRSFLSSLNIIAKLPVALQLLTSGKSGSQLRAEIDMKQFIPMNFHALQDDFSYLVSLVGVDREIGFV